MKELVRKFQEEGDREVIDKVLELSELDLKRMLDEGYVPEDDLFYVAYRIRAILMKNALHNFNFENRNSGDKKTHLRRELEVYIQLIFESNEYYKDELFSSYSVKKLRELEKQGLEKFKKAIEEEAQEYAEKLFLPFDRAINKVKREHDIDKPLDKLTTKDLPDILFSEVKRGNYECLKKIYAHELEVIMNDAEHLYLKFRGFPQPSYARMIKLIDQLGNFNPDGELFRKHYEKVKTDLLLPMVQGLEYALSKVDTERQSREMVKYINRAMLTKYIELVQANDGKKRVYDTKDKKNYFIKPKYEIDAWKLILDGKTLKNIGGIDSFDIYLTGKQKKLLLDVYEVVEQELKKENSQAFRWKKNNEPVIQKRFIAKKLGLNENSLKQRLKRATDKILENWNTKQIK
ncbi:hypothetical protein ABES80_12305 [Bacillus gobiensis]|uniref:hypothetical protein n=1 Tax=Bacillus gobiensis TaxID=1441095 RepID=UPI003D23DF05